MILFLGLIVAAVVVLWVRGRLQEMEARIAVLNARIREMEVWLAGGGGAAAPPLPPPPATAVGSAPAMPPPVPVAPAWQPPEAPQVPPFGPQAPPPAVAPPSAGLPPPAGPLPAGKSLDLESLIGGNWLSKLGVLLLLIGIALFLGFSLTEMGPMGRILTGATASVALLGGGMAAERKAAYRILGQALIGGGWAGLYFTVFAAHGLEASRVIESPGVGLVLLLGVACGMILHSLRYRNQTVTGLAFLAAFLAIAISSLTRFSAAASVPLLLGLLAVAWKFGWQGLSAAGALFAYAAYGFDLATGDKDRYFVAIGEPVLWLYWVILEGYDLAMKRRGARFPIAPLNLTGFLFATVAVWPPGGGWDPSWMMGSMAAAQLVSGALRGRWNAERELEDDSVWGGFRASVTYSAGFTAALILERFTGMERGFALALLAQTVAAAGWLFGSGYLRGLGAVLFAVTAVAGEGRHRPLYWSLAGAFLVNRLFLRGGVWYTVGAVLTAGGLLVDFTPKHLRPVLLTIAGGATGLLLRWRGMREGRWAGLALAGLSVCVLAARVPEELLWVTVGLPAVLYAAFGYAIPESPSRGVTFVLMQFYVGALLYRWIGETNWLPAAWAGAAAVSWVAGVTRTGASLGWSALLLQVLALLYWMFHTAGRQQDLAAQVVVAAALLAMHLAPAKGVARAGGAVHGVVAAVFVTAVIQDFVSGRSLTLAWSGEAAAFLGAGIALQRRQLRITGLVLFGLCLAKLFFHDFSQLDTLSRILSFIVLGLLLIVASWAYSRFREQIHRIL
jgi:uncharacterized membrane protein